MALYQLLQRESNLTAVHHQLTFLPFLFLVLPPMVELSMPVSQMPMCLHMLTKCSIFDEPFFFVLCRHKHNLLWINRHTMSVFPLVYPTLQISNKRSPLWRCSKCHDNIFISQTLFNQFIYIIMRINDSNYRF